jgi:hypothetical protein
MERLMRNNANNSKILNWDFGEINKNKELVKRKFRARLIEEAVCLSLRWNPKREFDPVAIIHNRTRNGAEIKKKSEMCNVYVE